MSDCTPSEEGVRDAWCAFMTEPFGYWDALDDAEADARFDRFLADDRRKTAARALQAAADDLWDESAIEAALDIVGWLRNRADEIEKGAPHV